MVVVVGEGGGGGLFIHGGRTHGVPGDYAQGGTIYWGWGGGDIHVTLRHSVERVSGGTI